jgi:hypothetical protein
MKTTLLIILTIATIAFTTVGAWAVGLVISPYIFRERHCQGKKQPISPLGTPKKDIKISNERPPYPEF